jgi:hypothetical protein
MVLVTFYYFVFLLGLCNLYYNFLIVIDIFINFFVVSFSVLYL